MKIVVIAVMVVLVLFAFFICETDVEKAEFTTVNNITSKESFYEPETVIKNTDDKNDIMLNMEKIKENVIEKFRVEKTVFEKTVELLSGEESTVLLSYERNNNILRLSVDNKIVPMENLFDKYETEIISNCFAQMCTMSSNEVRLLIKKQESLDYASTDFISIDFMFRTNFEAEYIDYGITYCKNIYDSNYEKIDDNWYWFSFGLV